MYDLGQWDYIFVLVLFRAHEEVFRAHEIVFRPDNRFVLK